MTNIRQAIWGLILGGAVAAGSGPAQAATLDVSPTGTGSACTPGSPCALATANSNAQPGDVVRLAPGTYASSISPARNGSAGARITYVGNLANPATTVVGSTRLTKRYISLKGMRFDGNFIMDRETSTQYAQFDSVAWCQVKTDFSVDQAKDCVAYRVDVTSGNGHFSMVVPSVPVGAFTIPERNTIRRCTMNLGLQQTTGFHIVFIRGAQRCVVDSNQINITMAANISAETDPLIAFYMKWCEFKDNKWTVHSNHNADHLFRWRDSTMYNRTYRDTILMSGYNIRFAPSSSGSWPGSTDQNYFEGLYVRKSCRANDVALFYQNGTRRDTLKNCVVIDSLGKAFQCLSIDKGMSLVDHCTFVGNSRYGVVEFPVGVGTFGDSWPPAGSMTFTNNLIVGLAAGGGISDCGISWQFSASTNNLTSRNNLYYVPNQGSSRAIRFGINNAAAVLSPPGTSSAFYSAFGEDGNSLYGNPLLANASFSGFDPRLTSGSPAIGAGSGGSDIGAIPYSGNDNVPPATVNDLAFGSVTDQTGVLSWTAPGDNGYSGTVTAYELKLSTTAITGATYPGLPAINPAPTNAVGGSFPQNYVLTGLLPNTTYYAALRARDDVGNWSGISNVAFTTTSGNDGVPPAAVHDLSASP